MGDSEKVPDVRNVDQNKSLFGSARLRRTASRRLMAPSFRELETGFDIQHASFIVFSWTGKNDEPGDTLNSEHTGVARAMW